MRLRPSWIVLSLAIGALGAACQSLEFQEIPAEGTGGAAPASTYTSTTATGNEPPPDPESASMGAEVGRYEVEPSLQHGGELGELLGVCAELPKYEHTSTKYPLTPHAGTASATWARAMLRQGRRPEPSLLRVEEFRAFYLPTPKLDEGGLMFHVRALPPSEPGGGGGGGEGGAGGGTGTKGAGGSEKPGEGGAGGSGLEPEASFEGWDALELVARVDTPALRAERLRVAVLIDVSPSMRDALPVTRGVIDAVAAGLDQSGDELAVLTYAGDVRVERALGSTAGQQDLSSELDLGPRTGSALDTALSAAFGLVPVGEPLHVVLVTDGATQATDAVLEQVAQARKGGSKLSVALVGKPERKTGAPPPSFRRTFGDQLVTRGGGGLHLLDSTTDVVEVLGGQGFARSFGTALRAEHLALALGPYFHLPVPDAAGSGQAGSLELAPLRSYVVRLPLLVCSAEVLETQAAALLDEVSLSLFGSDPQVPMLVAQPTSYQELGFDGIDWVDLAVTATVGALRGGSTLAASGQILEAQTALGCAQSPEAQGCDALEELEALLDLYASAN